MDKFAGKIHDQSNPAHRGTKHLGSTNKKAPEGAFLFCAMQGSGSSERLDLGGQAALGARSLVLVDDLLVGDAVEDGNRLLEDALSGDLVAGFDGLAHTLDRGT